MLEDILYAFRIVALIIYALFSLLYLYLFFIGLGTGAWMGVLGIEEDSFDNYTIYLSYTFVPILVCFAVLIYCQIKQPTINWWYVLQSILVSVSLLYTLVSHGFPSHSRIYGAIHLLLVVAFIVWDMRQINKFA